MIAHEFDRHRLQFHRPPVRLPGGGEVGEAAWQEARAEDFGLIVLDQQMPGLNGDAVIKKLRSHPPTRNTPVVMVTAKGLEMDAAQLKDDLDVSAVLSKPFSPTELIAQIKDVLACPADDC